MAPSIIFQGLVPYICSSSFKPLVFMKAPMRLYDLFSPGLGVQHLLA